MHAWEKNTWVKSKTEKQVRSEPNSMIASTNWEFLYTATAFLK